jgi:hypothetical protein
MIIQSDNITEGLMLHLADSMAAAATNISGQGYDQFILARDLFIATNHKLFTMPNAPCPLICPVKCTLG